MLKGPRDIGDFCWLNILTPEPEKAREFFTSLLGWSYREIPVGHQVMVGGQEIGGIFDLASPNTPQGAPPGIGLMVLVENADQMAERVADLGGTARPPFDVYDQGRMVDCHDPKGANLDLWQAGKSIGMTADESLHGAPCWYETMTHDIESSVEYYTSLFGWTVERQEMEGIDYRVFHNRGHMVAGAMQVLPDMGDFPTHWAAYFTVDDVDQSAELVSQLDGEVVMAPHDIAGVGRIAGVVSPQGVMFYILTHSETES